LRALSPRSTCPASTWRLCLRPRLGGGQPSVLLARRQAVPHRSQLASAPTPASRPRPVAFDLAARGASWPPPSGPGGCGPEPLADLEAIFGDPRRPCRGAVGEASAPWALSRGVLDTHALALVAPAAPAEPNGDPSLSAGSGDASCERRVAPCDRRGGRGRRSPCRSGHHLPSTGCRRRGGSSRCRSGRGGRR